MGLARRQDPVCSPRDPALAQQHVLSAIAFVAALSLVSSSHGGRDSAGAGGDVAGRGGPPPVLKIDPNTAPVTLLTILPALGPARAAAIVEERAARPFESPEDLERRVKGIGPATLERIRPYLRFEPPRGSPGSHGP